MARRTRSQGIWRPLLIGLIIHGPLIFAPNWLHSLPLGAPTVLATETLNPQNIQKAKERPFAGHSSSTWQDDDETESILVLDQEGLDDEAAISTIDPEGLDSEAVISTIDPEVISPAVGESDSRLSPFQPVNYRLTLTHEASVNLEEKRTLVGNRSGCRLNLEQFFGDHFLAVMDGKVTRFAANDHQSEAEGEAPVITSTLRELYLQMGLGTFNLKVGKQIVVWGEADGAVVTDVFSPRDRSEFLYTTLADSRIGQWMARLDRYGAAGRLSILFNPDAQGDSTPVTGSEYDYAALTGQSNSNGSESIGEQDPELGVGWKATFGKSDLSILVADLVSNRPVYIVRPTPNSGVMEIIAKYHRYRMIGLTGNLAAGSVLWKGELAYKNGLWFQSNDPAIPKGIVKQNVMDLALAADFSPTGTYTLGVEASVRHIYNRDTTLTSVQQDEGTLAVNALKSFCNDTLDLQYLLMVQPLHRDAIHQLKANAQLSDRLSVALEIAVLDIPDNESPFWAYRYKDRLTGRLAYQF